MQLSHLKNITNSLTELNFQLENGELIPKHFHITEIGIISKKFIDCGGKIREEKVVNFQLWHANDFSHRLKPSKLIEIIELAEKLLLAEDLTIEIEYQNETIGKYDLVFNGNNFVLMSKTTNCLAKDMCGIVEEKPKLSLSEIDNKNSSCSPGSGCC
jgi:hypothetical protein